MNLTVSSGDSIQTETLIAFIIHELNLGSLNFSNKQNLKSYKFLSTIKVKLSSQILIYDLVP